MRPSKAQRYRRLALKETNKALIGLFHRLADEAELRERQSRPGAGPATIIRLDTWRTRRAQPVRFLDLKAS